ncbi:MAG: NUDIX domain-containing protein [Gemmatimonadetes bacterium]|nr:NUDIX domain-containing protein [Gemmatimonadota bacterium]
MARTVSGGEPHVLLIRDPYRNWGLPKGHVETQEDAAAAALREVREETGIDDLELGPLLGTIDWYFRVGDELIHKFCVFYLMRSERGDPLPEVGEGITECRWLPIPAAIRKISYDNTRGVLRKAAKVLERVSG